MQHVPGEQKKMPEGEAREEAEKTIFSKAPGPQGRGAEYGAGRQKQANCRRLGNGAGVVKR